MAKDNVIGLAMGLDVADLKAGINEVKKLVKQSKDEFNLATAGLDKWTNSADGLTAKVNQLNKQLDAQKKAVAGYKAEIERVSKEEGDHSLQIEKLKEKLTQAEIAVKKTESSLNKYSNSLSEITAENKKSESSFALLTQEISEQKNKLSELEYEYKDAVLTYGKNSKQAKSLAKQISNLSDELNENEAKSKKSDKALENLEKQLDDTGDEAKDLSEAFDDLKNTGGKIAGGIAAIGGAVGGLITGFLATAEGTRELRTNLGKLETAFSTAGLSAEQAQKTYTDLYAVVADEGKATEATAHIAKLAKSQEDLNKWTNICTGVYATFGDSLPIENLTEAANETAKTGKITGGLADSLNWCGVSEEKFQASLDKCSNEQERNKLITETLNSLYNEASATYQQTNKDVIESNKAQAELSNTMAELGEKAEPIMTEMKNGFNRILDSVIDLVSGADFDGIQKGIENAFDYAIDTVIPAIVDGFQWIMDNKDTLIAGVVGIGTAMLAWNVVGIVQGVVGAIKAWMVATEGMTVAQGLLNLVMAANPVGLVVAAIAGLVAAFVVLWNKSDKFRNFWINLWKKIQDSTSKAIEAIKKWFSGAWTSVTKVWGKAVKWFKDIGDKISKGFKEATDKTKKAFSDGWEKSKKAWSNTKKWFSDVGTSVSNGFKKTGENIKSSFQTAKSGVNKAWSSVSGWFGNIANKIISKFKETGSKVLTSFKNAWRDVKAIWSPVANIFKEIVKKIIEKFMNIPSRLKSYFKSALDNIKQVWNNPGKFFKNVANKILQQFINFPKKIKAFFAEAWRLVKLAWSNPTKFFNDVKNKIINKFKELPGKLPQVGKDLVRGLWNGIKDMGTWIGKKIKGFTGDVLTKLKDFFGIKSPSKETAEMGKFLVEGLGLGLEKNGKKAVQSSEKLADEILNSISKIEKGMPGESANPFESWEVGDIDKAISEIQKKYEVINKLLTENGENSTDWGNSAESINERAKILEKRLQAQNWLMQLLNAEVKKFEENEAPNWVYDTISNIEDAKSETSDYFEELKFIYQDFTENATSDFAETIKEVTDKSAEEVIDFFNKADEEAEIEVKVDTSEVENVVKDTKKVTKESENIFKNWAKKIKDIIESDVSISDKFQKMSATIGEIGDKIYEKLSDYSSQISDIFNRVIDGQMDQIDYELDVYNKQKDEEMEKEDERYNERIANLESQKEQGIITDDEYQANKLALEQEHDNYLKQAELEKEKREQEALKKKNELARKQFIAEQANAIANTVIQGLLAIVKGFAELGPIGGAVNAGIQTALTAASVATIASQKYVPMLAKGGIVDNPTMAIIGEDGKEAVMPLENNTGWIFELAEKISAIMQKNYLGNLGYVTAGANIVNGDTINNYYYTQNINAPKTPSRKELYRDTKNLLSLKGV